MTYNALTVTAFDGTVYVCTPSVVHVGSRQYGSWLWSARGAGTAEGCVAALCDALQEARRELPATGDAMTEREREIREAIKGHTPGPWVYEFEKMGGYDSLSDSYVIEARGYEVCEIDPASRDRAEADAALIAAAPDLLSLLDAARAEAAREADQLMGDMAGVRKDAAAAERERIREALLKAVHRLISRPYVGDGFTSTQRLVTRDSVENAIERICGPTGAGGHEG